MFISALLPNSKSFDLLLRLHKVGCELLSPEFLAEEVKGKLDKLSRKSGISKQEMLISMNLMLRWVRIVPKSVYKQFLSEAKRISLYL